MLSDVAACLGPGRKHDHSSKSGTMHTITGVGRALEHKMLGCFWDCKISFTRGFVLLQPFSHTGQFLSCLTEKGLCKVPVGVESLRKSSWLSVGTRSFCCLWSFPECSAIAIHILSAMAEPVAVHTGLSKTMPTSACFLLALHPSLASDCQNRNLTNTSFF